jgi:hypothetical protein
MTLDDQPVMRSRLFLQILVLALAFSGYLPNAGAESCRLEPEHGGMTFPVQRVADGWTCRLRSVIDNYTTANRLGPLTTALDEAMYQYLLEHPALAAALINRLDLADYKAEARGADQWWGSDGEGAEGMVHLVYRDRTSRVYYLEGTHRSRLLPNLSGKAVVFLRMAVVREPSGREAIENTLVVYTMLDNRMLSGLASLLRPLVGATVSRKLTKGVDVVNRLGLEMRHRPERVLFEATDPPSMGDDDVTFLKAALGAKAREHVTGGPGMP